MSNIRESFIPFRRTDIINLCLEDGKLQGKDVQLFQDFCDILTAFFHFRFHNTLENIKDNPHYANHHLLWWFEPHHTTHQSLTWTDRPT